MKMTKPSANVSIVKHQGREYMFSYETCVAGWDEDGAFRTNKFHSRTTNKHISQYLGGADAREVDQDFCDAVGA